MVGSSLLSIPFFGSGLIAWGTDAYCAEFCSGTY
jgi:hypothetical protein